MVTLLSNIIKHLTLKSKLSILSLIKRAHKRHLVRSERYRVWMFIALHLLLYSNCVKQCKLLSFWFSSVFIFSVHAPKWQHKVKGSVESGLQSHFNMCGQVLVQLHSAISFELCEALIYRAKVYMTNSSRKPRLFNHLICGRKIHYNSGSKSETAL